MEVDALGNRVESSAKSGTKNGQKKRGRLYTEESTVIGIMDQRKLLPNFESKTDVEGYERRKRRAKKIKYAVLLIMFLSCTVFQAFIGVKCVQFKYKDNGREVAQGIMFGIIVLCINAEIFLFKSLVEAATDMGEWVLIPSLHPHPLEKAKRYVSSSRSLREI